MNGCILYKLLKKILKSLFLTLIKMTNMVNIYEYFVELQWLILNFFPFFF